MDESSLSYRLLAILFPIFGIVAAGYFYGRKHKPEMAVANRLNMDVFVPALVFAFKQIERKRHFAGQPGQQFGQVRVEEIPFGCIGAQTADHLMVSP